DRLVLEGGGLLKGAPGALLSVNPNSANAGQTVTVTLSGTGTGWTAGQTVASFGAGISVGGATPGAPGPIQVTDVGTATATLPIGASAAPGARDVTITTPVPGFSSGETETLSGAFTVQAAPTDTTPPLVAITSPADGFTTTATSITVSGTASDPGQFASGVASVTVNGSTATRDAVAGTWTLSGVALALGANTITAVAKDNAGNSASASINVTRNPTTPPDTTPPNVTITTPAAGTTVITTSITVTGTAIDPGTNATGVA